MMQDSFQDHILFSPILPGGRRECKNNRPADLSALDDTASFSTADHRRHPFTNIVTHSSAKGA